MWRAATFVPNEILQSEITLFSRFRETPYFPGVSARPAQFGDASVQHLSHAWPDFGFGK